MGESAANFYRRKLPETCIAFCSPEGRTLFSEALTEGYMEGYFSLAAQFRTQDEPAFCGLSSLVMALNALEIDPGKVWRGPWRWYHEEMLSCCAPLDDVRRQGITVDQFACLAACNQLHVETVRPGLRHTIEDFRAAVRKVTQSAGSHVLVASYGRGVLKQTGDGHFSPIAGYHPEGDMVLILDTARFKYPPHWVSLPLLWDAMQVCDSSTGRPRGYFLLRRRALHPLLVFTLSPCLHVPAGQCGTPWGPELEDFMTVWEGWLGRPCPTAQVDQTAVLVDEAMGRLGEALGFLSGSASVLTTQFACKGSRQQSSQHEALARTLMDGIEATELFHIVMAKLNAGEDVARAVTRAGVVTNGGKGGCGRSTPADAAAAPSREPLSACRNGDDAECTCDVGRVLGLGPAHFLTVLLLAWPYKMGADEYCTNGVSLAAAVGRAMQARRPGGVTNPDHDQTTVSSADLHVNDPTDVLLNELEGLKDQLSGVLHYRRCHTKAR